MDNAIEKRTEYSVQQKAMIFSLIFTGIIWLILILTFAFAPPFQKKEIYREIKISLDIVDKVVEKSVPKKTETPKKIEKPVEPKKNPTPTPVTPKEKVVAKENTTKSASTVQKTTPTEPAKKTQNPAATSQKTASTTKNPSAPAKSTASSASTNTKSQETPAPRKARITYKKSTEELMEEQFGSAKSTDWDESVFENVSEASSNSKSSVNSNLAGTAAVASTISGSDAFAGTAGTLAKDTGGAIAKSENSTTKGSVSKSTSEALGKISSTNYSVPEENGVTSSVSVTSTTDSDGKVTIEMTDKSTRTLLDPKKPYIMISEDNAALIDSSRTVTIEFAVLASGAVPFSRIEFVPSSLLPQPVQSEIRTQISKWRFSTASSDGLARLEYSIKKR